MRSFVTTFCLFIHPLMRILVVMTIMDNAVMNIHLQIFVLTNVLNSLGDIPRSVIVRSCGKSMFNLLSNCQTFPKWLVMD